MREILRCIGLFAISSAAFISPANSNQIHTGGPSGSYHTAFCPLLQQRLEALGSSHQCATSDGSSANIRRVVRDPSDFAFSQLDVFALESQNLGGARRFSIVRSDDVRECVFAVTRNKSLTNFGQLAVNADDLRFVLPPEQSGSARTFAYLQKIDPDGLGQARRVNYADGTDEAIRAALADNSAVTFFVQFPDPKNERFQLIKRLGGHIVPVVDGTILRQRIGGQSVYFAQDTGISQQPHLWNWVGKRVITACTPMILMTGNSNNVQGISNRQEHERLIAILRGTERSALVPRTDRFRAIIQSSREISRRAKEHFVRLSADARERALPLIERAYRSARRGIHEMILKARPQ